MKKAILIIFLIAVAIIVAATLMPSQLPQTNTVGDECCMECKTAFEQSPVGVGPQAAQCGEFTTGMELSEQCKAFFAEKPMTVTECGMFSAWYE
jgi:hypothetical protein